MLSVSSRWSVWTVLLLLLFSLISLNSCSDNDNNDSDQASPDIPVTLEQDSAPPGTLVTLAGLDPSLYSPADLEVVLESEGGTTEEKAFVVSDGLGGVGFVAPLYYDAIDKWASPPEQAVDIKIFHKGQWISTISQAFTVEPLPQAPGTTDKIIADIRQIVQDVTAISNIFPREVSLEDQYLSAILGTLDVLVNGDSPYSLATVMADIDTDPDTKALLDSLFVTSGAEEHIAKLRELVASLRQPVLPATTFSFFVSQAAAATIPTPIGDTSLAERIQLYEILQLFGQEVVSSTALWAGTLTGLIGVVASVPPVVILQAIITVTDFALNKLLVSALPSHLTGIELTLANTQLELEEVTDSTVTLRAANTPVAVTLGDMVSYALNIMGFGGGVRGPSSWVNSFEAALTNAVGFATGEMQARITAYASAHPGNEIELDMDVTNSWPAMSWEATATNRDLLTLFSSAPSILATLPDEINWEADSENRGTSSIHVQTASGAGTLLWNLPSWLIYAGGAYGTDVVSSESITVNVASNLGLEASFPESILPSGSGVLHVLAGDLLPDNSIDPKPGFDVAVQVTGGSPEESLGTTDAQGQFTTVIWPDDEVTEMVINVLVADPPTDRSAEANVEVAVGGDVITLIDGSVHLGDNNMTPYVTHIVEFDVPADYSVGTAMLELDITEFDLYPLEPNILLNGVRLGINEEDVNPDCIVSIDLTVDLGPNCFFRVYECSEPYHLTADVSVILLGGQSNTFTVQSTLPSASMCTNSTTANWDDFDISNVRIISR